MIPLHPAENHKAHSVFARILDAQLIAAYSLRTDGNMSLGCGDTAHALEDRERFLSRLGIGRYAIVCCRQVHGDRVVRVRRIDAGRGARDNESAIPACDALITNEREVPLAVFTADCLPIFLYDPVTHSAGIVHAGWRSTACKLAVNTVGLMRDEFGCRAADIRAAFGPAIRDCCYEVSREFTEIFPQKTHVRHGRVFFDLAQTNREQLLSAGIKPRHIIDHGICTACRPEEYFSFRREGPACGRMMSVVELL